MDPADIQRMATVLEHRGPDDVNTWCDGSIGLGHSMLWTTPESLQKQPPVTSQSGKLIVSADVRLDNRVELIGALGLKHRIAEEIGDHELILGAIEKWGEGCATRLLGDFAFAI